jgi:putative addiction module CopG family antidote
MRYTQRLSISLPDEMAQMVKQKVAEGVYASESDVIADGLLALQERDSAVERWLLTDVSAAYDAYKADPSRAEDIADVIRQLEADDRQSLGERH